MNKELKSELMIRGIDRIEIKNGYQYCGKCRKHNKTYYEFVDDDYLPHYYSPQEVLDIGSEIRPVDVMFRVADLGLLRANKDELTKIENYLENKYNKTNITYKVTDYKIYAYKPNGPASDITFAVLYDIYNEE